MTILSVYEMVSQINKHYPLKPYLYEVRIFGGSSAATDADPDIMVNCSAINIPGKNIQYQPHKKYGIGIQHQLPVGRSFTELNLTLYETEYLRERRYFSEWQDRIYDSNTGRYNYYKDYVKTISIIQYDKKENKTYECKINEAFPTNISPSDRAYSADGLAQFNVNLQFYDVEEVFLDKENGFSLFNLL